MKNNDEEYLPAGGGLARARRVVRSVVAVVGFAKEKLLGFVGAVGGKFSIVSVNNGVWQASATWLERHRSFDFRQNFISALVIVVFSASDLATFAIGLIVLYCWWSQSVLNIL